MPIEPSAVSVAGGGIALAPANTDMVMPTATQRNSDETPAFAQLLEVSFASVGQAPSILISGVAPSSHRTNETASWNPSIGTDRKPVKLHQAVDSSVPTSGDTLPATGAAESDPTRSYTLMPATIPADPASSSTNEVSSSEPVALVTQTLERFDQPVVVPMAAIEGISSLQAPSLPFRSTDGSSYLSTHGAARPAGTPVQTTHGLVEFAPSVPPASSSTWQDEPRGGVGSGAVVPNTSPTVSASSEISPATVKTTMTVGAAIAPPLPMKSNEELPNRAWSSTLIRNTSAADAIMAEPNSVMTNVTTTARTGIAPPSAPLPFLPNGQTGTVQDAETVISRVSAPARGNLKEAAAQADSFPWDPTIVSPPPAQNTAAVPAPDLWTSLPLVPGNSALSNTAQGNNDTVPVSANPTMTALQDEGPAKVAWTEVSTPDIPASPTPSANLQVKASSNAPSFEPLATSTSVSPWSSIPQSSDGSIVAQTVSVAETFVASDIPGPTEAAAMRVGSPTSPESARAVQSTMQIWTAQSAVATTNPLPKPDNSNKSVVPTIPFVSDSNVSSAQGGQRMVAMPVLDASVRRQKPHQENSDANAKSGASVETQPSALPQFPSPDVTSTSSPKNSGVMKQTSLFATTPTNIVQGDLTSSNDTVAPSAPSADLAPALPVLPNPDLAAIPSPGIAMRNAPMTTSDTAEDIQGQTNAHASHGEGNAMKESTTPLAPVFGSNEAPPAAQAVSLVASSPKLNSGVSASDSGSESHASASSDAPLPSPVLARQSAETGELSAGLQAWNGGDNAQTRLIQSAHLGGNVRESEMSIALQADALGNVELRARVAGDVVGAAIGVERHDAHAAISSDLPALHQALHDRQLRVGDVSVFQSSLHSGGATGDGRPSQHRETASQRPAATQWTAGQNSTLPDIAAFGESHDAGTLFDSNGRLSVRA